MTRQIVHQVLVPYTYAYGQVVLAARVFRNLELQNVSIPSKRSLISNSLILTLLFPLTRKRKCRYSGGGQAKQQPVFPASLLSAAVCTSVSAVRTEQSSLSLSLAGN
jgi:hypothetical protein